MLAKFGIGRSSATFWILENKEGEGEQQINIFRKNMERAMVFARRR